jgi:hypothetical protein
MTFDILLFFAKPETKFWGTMVILFVIGLGYLANKLTRGKATNYIYYDINDNVKKTLMFIHGFGPLILALLLPNNYLNEIDFLNKLYEENELWIAGTILILLFPFIILFGTTFTFFARLFGLKKIDEATSK